MYFVDGMLIVLALGIGVLLREVRRVREDEMLWDGDDVELTPMNVVGHDEKEDRRVN
jgi:hypothetical protein